MSERHPTISTHVLDTGSGLPAAGVTARLARLVDDGAEVEAGAGMTDLDGRIGDLSGTGLTVGDYRLHFDLTGQGGGFFRAISLDLRIDDAERDYHVPLLLAPFGLTTYRGS